MNASLRHTNISWTLQSPPRLSANGRLFYIVLACFPLPIFFNESGLYKDYSVGAARGFPLSLFFVFFLFLIPIYLKQLKSILTLVIWVSFCFYVPAIYSVAIGTHDGFDLLWIYLLSIFAGLGAYVVFLAAGLETFDQAARLFSLTLAPIAILWTIYQIDTFLSFGRANGDFWGLLAIYQVWVYWPTILAVMFCLSWYQRVRLKLLLSIIYFIAIVFTGAREPLLIISVFYILYHIGKFWRKEISGFQAVAFTLSPIFLLTIIASVTNFYPQSIIAKKLTGMWAGEVDFAGGRIAVLEQFDLIDVQPFFGTGFSLLDSVFGSTHNQYIELYYRGGFISLLAFLPIIVIAVRSVKRNRLEIFECLVCSLLLVSFNANVPMRAPYAGVMFWFLFFHLIATANKTRPLMSSKRTYI